MAVDPTIALRSKPAVFNPATGSMKGMQMRDMMDSSKLKNMQMMQVQRNLNKQIAMDDAAKSATVNGNFDTDAYANAVSSVDPLTGHKIKMDNASAKVSSRKAQLENASAEMEMMSKVLSGVNDPVTYANARATLQNYGLDVTSVPEQYNPQYVESAKQWTLKASERLSHELAVDKLDETKRHNKATESAPDYKYVQDDQGMWIAIDQKTNQAINTGQQGKLPSGMTITSDGEGGFTMTQGSGVGLGKPTMNKVEQKVLNAGDTLAQLTSIQSRYKPEFQEIGTKTGMAWTALKDKINSDSLSPEEKANLEEFTAYRADAGQMFALTLKELSGVAVNPTEMKRAETWLPNPGTGVFDGDSPAQLKGKLDRFEEFTRRALMKYAYVQKNGLDINNVDVDDMPGLMNKRGAEIEQELASQNLPAADLKAAVKTRLADEFGLANY